MKSVTALLAVFATGGLLIMSALPVASAPKASLEMATSGALEPTAGKKAAAKKATPAKKAAAKSCGTFKYPDKKTGKCVDARDKKR